MAQSPVLLVEIYIFTIKIALSLKFAAILNQADTFTEKLRKLTLIVNTVANLRGWVDDAFTINSLLSNVWQKQ
ncbi:hypothetical protein NIES2107_04540 [Nostoc carneum NIES-2107]|nr:hypothetical protein NIES2107_04540 [Nostoc carneum NIES-2107]